MSLNKLSFVLLGFCGVLLLSNCRKSDRNNEVINPAPRENTLAATLFNDIFRIIHAVSIENSVINGPQDNTVTNAVETCINSINYAYLTENYPNTMVVDFGDEQTACATGDRIRNGKLRLDFSGRYSDSLTTINVEFVGYYVDSIQVEATFKLVNRGRNSSNQPMYRMLVTDAYLSRDTINYTWNSTRLYTFTEGYNSISITDDKFEITGDSDGRTSRGNSYESEITTSLTTDFSCNWFVGGEEKLTPEGLTNRTVTYGNSCSSSVSVMYYNTEYEFTID